MGERAHRRRMHFAACEQLLGLRQAALADAQLRHRGDRRRAHHRHVTGVRRKRALQRALRLGPAAGGQQDVRVDGAAGAEQRRRVVLASEIVDELAPLRGAFPLARARARHDQVAVGLAERVDAADAPGRGRRHGLLEQLHPLLPAPGADLRPPQEAEREHLEVAGVRLPRDRHREPRVLGALLHALRVPRALHRHPAVPRAAPGAFERALRAGQPAARGRGASRDEVLVRDPHGDARGVVASRAAHVLLEGALARGDRLLHGAEEPERLTQAIVRLGRLLDGERSLERCASHVPARGLERAPALEELIAAVRRVHRGIIPNEADRPVSTRCRMRDHLPALPADPLEQLRRERRSGSRLPAGPLRAGRPGRTRPRRGSGLPRLGLRPRRGAAGAGGARRGPLPRGLRTRRSTPATSSSPTSSAGPSTRSRPATSGSTGVP